MSLAGSPRATYTSPAEVAIVRCKPVGVVGYADSKLTIDLYVEAKGYPLYSMDIKVGFVPSIARVEDNEPGPAGVQILTINDDPGFKSEQVTLNKACNNVDVGDIYCTNAGVIWYSANQNSPTLPFTGESSFARVTFLPQIRRDVHYAVHRT